MEEAVSLSGPGVGCGRGLVCGEESRTPCPRRGGGLLWNSDSRRQVLGLSGRHPKFIGLGSWMVVGAPPSRAPARCPSCTAPPSFLTGGAGASLALGFPAARRPCKVVRLGGMKNEGIVSGVSTLGQARWTLGVFRLENISDQARGRKVTQSLRERSESHQDEFCHVNLGGNRRKNPVRTSQNPSIHLQTGVRINLASCDQLQGPRKASLMFSDLMRTSDLFGNNTTPIQKLKKQQQKKSNFSRAASAAE